MPPCPLRLAIALLFLGLPALAAAQSHGPQRAYMDTTCSPCRDFFQYANGTWLATTEIPAAYPAYGMGFEINDRNQVTLTRVLERAAAGAAKEKDATLRKLGWLYAVLMDSTRADREGMAPVQADIERIETIATKEGLRREFSHPDGYSPFAVTVEADPAQSTMNLAQLWQGGLGLPDRDYYFRDDARSDTLRGAYVAHIERVLMLTGMASGAAREAAGRVMKLETALAESSLSVTEQREPEKLYHKMTVRQLRELCPAIDWPALFSEVGAASLTRADAPVDVSMPAFMRQLGRLVETTPLRDWRAYLRYHTARAVLPWLGQAAFDETFAFNSRLTGQQVPTPRWKRCANAVDGAMGEALGKAYVATEFPPSSKARMAEMVGNLRRALQHRIETRPWMSAATRQQALEKLGTFLPKIGYPDTWRDYSALTVEPKDPAVTSPNVRGTCWPEPNVQSHCRQKAARGA